ncbi:MAG: NUDIX hydrolase [Natronospirillum sp.]
MNFQPHVTVAALIKSNGRYLIVEEMQHDRKVYNQPAGHVEAGETLLAACAREAFEETRWHVRPTHLVGVYVYTAPNGLTYYRFGYAADVVREDTAAELDTDIIGVHRLTLEEIRALHHRGELRSPLVLKMIEDSLAGQAYPLALIDEGFNG